MKRCGIGSNAPVLLEYFFLTNFNAHLNIVFPRIRSQRLRSWIFINVLTSEYPNNQANLMNSSCGVWETARPIFATSAISQRCS